MSLSRCRNTAISVIPVRLKRGHQSLCANRAREQLRAQLKRPWHRVCCVTWLRGERMTKKERYPYLMPFFKGMLSAG